MSGALACADEVDREVIDSDETSPGDSGEALAEAAVGMIDAQLVGESRRR
jgi:hypothetical protein